MKIRYALIVINFMIIYAQDINQIKKQIEAAGISNEQAKQIAKDKGFTDEQIDNELRSRGLGSNASDPIYEDGVNDLSSDLDDFEILDYQNNDDEKNESINKQFSEQLDYFGYQIFQRDPSAFQASEFGSADPNYNISPGDQIIVMLWGESQFRQEFTINREGFVFIPEVGQVFVNGLNLEALEKKLFQIMSKVYSTLKPKVGLPTTFMDVSLGNLRPLRIIVLGEVSQPGSYSVSPSTSLSSSLYYFNGPTTSGSLRNIQLLRGGKRIGSIDFYDYLLYGKVPDDLRLQIDDIIFIPFRGKTVTIKGEIRRPGYFELNNDEGLDDLIEIAGGLSVTAYSNRVQISRIVPRENRSSVGMDRMIIDVDLEEVMVKDENVKLLDGDIVEVFPIGELYENYVEIIGSSISRPGRYQLIEGMRISDLINASDGLLSNAFLDIAHLKRQRQDLSTELIDINLKDLLAGKKDIDMKLSYLDKLIIYNNFDLNNLNKFVSLDGPLKNTGNFPLEKSKSLGDLIILAGGFKENINKVKISIARSNPNSFVPEIIKFPENNSFITTKDLHDSKSRLNQFLLYPNDFVSVYSDPKDNVPNIVHIGGSVYYPGSYPILADNEKVLDIINRAGGLLKDAYPLASSFKRNNLKINLSFEKIIRNPNSKDNFIIMSNDSIIISKRPNIIKVEGAVLNPGLFKYYDDKSLKYYINLSGGFAVNAEKKEVWINYPDGTNKQMRTLFPSPKVYDGSVISIGFKEDTEPFDLTEFSIEITTVLANLAQVIILYSALK